MTAPVLSLDYARSFEVPCTWNGEPARLSVAVDFPRGSWRAALHLRLQTLWLDRAMTWSSDVSSIARFPTAQAAVDAAFATEQIEAPGPGGASKENFRP